MVEHHLDLHQLEEDHQLYGQQGIIRRPHALHVEIHLIGNHPQLVEAQGPRHLAAGVFGIGPVPTKLVQPLLGFGDEQLRPTNHTPFDMALLLPIDHDRLIGMEGNGVSDGDLGMLDGI